MNRAKAWVSRTYPEGVRAVGPVKASVGGSFRKRASDSVTTTAGLTGTFSRRLFRGEGATAVLEPS